MSNCANLYNTFVTAIALDAIGWKYYLVFVALNFEAAVWFILGVETRGRTLEELNSVFNAKWPPKEALKKATLVKAEGRLEEL